MNERSQQFPATPGDLEGVDLETPLSNVVPQHGWSFQDGFQRAKAVAEKSGHEAAARVYESLAKLCSCVGNFNFPREPYRPLWSNRSQRSFIPDDLTEADVALLEALVSRIKLPWLRARIIDFLFLKRARRELWPQAVTAYLSAALDCYPTAPEEGLNCFTRGLYLGRALGKESEPRREAEKATLEFVRGNASTVEPRSAVGLLRLIQTVRIGEAAEFSALASTLAQSFSAQQKFDEARGAWLICGRWLRQMDEEEGCETAFRNAAELFEREGDIYLGATPARTGAAVNCFLRGVEALRQSRAADEDINRVRQKVRHCQRLEQEEMRRTMRKKTAVEQNPIAADLQKAAAAAPTHVAGLPWPEALLRLSAGLAVVEPARIRERVLEFAEMAPMQALMQKEYPDEMGRVAYRQSRLLLTSGEQFENAMREAMFEHAREYEWNIRAETFIEPCRQKLWEEHQPGVQDFGCLVAANPIIPPAHAYSIVCGLHAGMSGDWLISSHLLAVKFEPILRYFLDRKRIDTSNIESDLTQPSKLLGGLLDLAETHRALPEGYIFEMRGMLNEKTGYDSRNRIAHGFASDGECYESGAAVNLWWLMLNILVNASVLLGED